MLREGGAEIINGHSLEGSPMREINKKLVGTGSLTGSSQRGIRGVGGYSHMNGDNEDEETEDINNNSLNVFKEDPQLVPLRSNAMFN
jgi:hypothetical protein